MDALNISGVLHVSDSQGLGQYLRAWFDETNPGYIAVVKKAMLRFG